MRPVVARITFITSMLSAHGTHCESHCDSMLSAHGTHCFIGAGDTEAFPDSGVGVMADWMVKNYCGEKP